MEHRRALLRNLVTELFRHERIQTTTAKAKEARRLADRLVTYAKRGGLARRRLAGRYVKDNKVLQHLFEEVGPRYADRPGGYTRVIKLRHRLGDAGEIAILELMGAGEIIAKRTAAAEATHEEKGKKKGRKKPETVDVKAQAEPKKKKAKAPAKTKSKEKE
jgi:large subunit ribosomal protein L17